MIAIVTADHGEYPIRRRHIVIRAGHTAAGDDNDAFSDAVVAFVRRLTG